MPSSRHSERSRILAAQLGQRVDRVGHAAAAHFAVVHHEAGWSAIAACTMRTRSSARRVQLVAVRRVAGRQETHFRQPQLLPQLERRAQVAAVDRVEGAAEQADGRHQPTRGGDSTDCAVAGRPHSCAANSAISSQASPAQASLDHAVGARGAQRQLRERQPRGALQRLGERGAVALPGRRPALARARAPHVAQRLGERPQRERGLGALGAQPGEHAQRPRRIARRAPLRRAGTRRSARCRRRSPRGPCRRDVRAPAARASPAPGARPAGCPRCARRAARSASSPTSSPSGARAAAQPAHQARRVHRPDLHPGTVALERAHPLGALRIAIEARGQHQQQRVGVARRRAAPPASRRRRRRACRSCRRISMTRRGREQRQVAGRGAHVVPVGGALDEVHLTLAEAGGARPRAHRVRRLAGRAAAHRRR